MYQKPKKMSSLWAVNYKEFTVKSERRKNKAGRGLLGCISPSASDKMRSGGCWAGGVGVCRLVLLR